MPPKLHIHLTLLALPILLLLALPAITHAGTYKVYSCKLPDGSPAPTDGWSPLYRKAQFAGSANSCPQGGALSASLPGNIGQINDAHVGWTYALPSGVNFEGLRVWRRFSVTPASGEVNATPVTFMSWPGPNLSPDSKEDCVAAFGCSAIGAAVDDVRAEDLRAFGSVGPDVRALYFWAGCGGSWDCASRNSVAPMAEIRIKALEATLRDNSSPSVSKVRGELTTTGIHSGVEALSFTAADDGAGLYRVLVETRPSDDSAWARRAAAAIDPSATGCRDVVPNNQDEYEFAYRVPCPTRSDKALDFDTRVLANGRTQVRVIAEDAAGNRSIVLSQRRFSVSNGPDAGQPERLGVPNNGSGATNSTRLTISKSVVRAGRKLRFGQRFKLVATVRNERGEPVRGAKVDVLQRVKLPKATFKAARKALTTGANGKVRWVVPAGTSRTLRLAYKANRLNYSYQSTTDLPLAVRAATTLKRNKRSYRNGETIRFGGRVRSKPIPKGGILIDLQAYKRGAGWVTFATRRSSRKGRWAIRYRLMSTTRTVRYRFRARIRQDSAYPYAAGRSKSVAVVVRA